MWIDNMEKPDSQYDRFSHLSEKSNRPRKYPRLSRPLSAIRSEYDVVIVGSGYGAGVAASRMARAGRKVAVLEFGLERWPGEYPADFKEAVHELHISGNVARDANKVKDVDIGKTTGLYNLVLGQGQNVFVGKGLGGTSLINANVFLRADHRTLQLSAWPPEIRNTPESLDKYYQRAAQMLSPTPYPSTSPHLRKLEILQRQAESLGLEEDFYLAPQTTFFHNGLNNAGVEMSASMGSGQDCTGINDGSKNTVLVTYLADAWNWGAEIFCECEVRYVKKHEPGGGYTVHFIWNGGGRESFKDEQNNNLMWIRAKELCILGAGALGTTSILLRSQKCGLEMSSMIGKKLSGNGDVLSFAYNSDEIINGIGKESPNLFNPSGPTITGVIDARDVDTSSNVLDSYIIQEGVVPAALAPLMQTMLGWTPMEARTGTGHHNWLRFLVSSVKSILFGPYSHDGSLNRTQTLLAMSHDSNEGVLRLENDKPYLEFSGVGTTSHEKPLHKALARLSHAIGGTLVDCPSFFYPGNEISAHPLGGAIMSSDGTGRRGAVDNTGRVFSGEGVEVHEGLLCVDASIIPSSLAANPLATITALAERSCETILNDKGWIANESPNETLDLFGKPRVSHPFSDEKADCNEAANQHGVRFTEVMEGNIHIGKDITDFQLAYDTAKGSASTAKLYITVDVVEPKVPDGFSESVSQAVGTFSCGALSQSPMIIVSGDVRFFTVDEKVSDTKNLIYDLALLSVEGKTYFLQGTKIVDSSMALSVRQAWKATTTMYTTITSVNGSLVGRGIIHISFRNFMRELRSFRSIPTVTGFVENFSASVPFTRFFARNIATYFLAPFRSLQFPDKTMTGYFEKTPPSKVETLVAEDGVKTSIKVWQPLVGSVERDTHILLMPGASVDDQVFSLPTIPRNTVEYFTKLGYRCYVATLRFGMVDAAQQGCTAYDARLDVKAAMEFVRNEEGEKKFYVVCHCLGSIATGIALLTGAVDAKWIRGMTCSQVFTHLRFAKVNRMKARTQTLLKLYQTFAGPWFSIDSTPTSPSFQRLIDELLRFYPVGESHELCNSTVCHRGSLVFGRLWTHSNLNHATHSHLSNFFGGVHMSFLSHLTLMGATSPHHLRDNLPEFEDLVVKPENFKRLQGLKIQFVSGGASAVYDPLSTSESYDMLRHEFGTEDYERVVIAGYGHLDTWMGKDSCKDVYPVVQWHLEKCEEG